MPIGIFTISDSVTPHARMRIPSRREKRRPREKPPRLRAAGDDATRVLAYLVARSAASISSNASWREPPEHKSDTAKQRGLDEPAGKDRREVYPGERSPRRRGKLGPYREVKERQAEKRRPRPYDGHDQPLRQRGPIPAAPRVEAAKEPPQPPQRCRCGHYSPAAAFVLAATMARWMCAGTRRIKHGSPS
jgi:hypothetical protein